MIVTLEEWFRYHATGSKGPLVAADTPRMACVEDTPGWQAPGSGVVITLRVHEGPEHKAGYRDSRYIVKGNELIHLAAGATGDIAPACTGIGKAA